MSNKTAVDYFSQGYSCSQSVLLGHAETLGMPEQIAVRAAAGFGGGMGRQALTCGAVTGALIALGLRFGSLDPNDKAAKERMYEMVRQFSAEFAARNGSLTCRDLLGVDISTPDGYAQVRANDLFHTRCTGLVQSAGEILQAMLDRTVEP